MLVLLTQFLWLLCSSSTGKYQTYEIFHRFLLIFLVTGQYLLIYLFFMVSEELSVILLLSLILSLDILLEYSPFCCLIPYFADIFQDHLAESLFEGS